MIMPVIKANAYGVGVKGIIPILNNNNIKIVGVAIVDEGIYLRKLGYSEDIFVLNQPLVSEIPSIIKYNLTIGASSDVFVHELGKYKDKFKIHIEIGTGMGRTGIHPYRVQPFIDILKQYSNIQVDGVYTHFSCSDTDEEYTKKQIKSFNVAIDSVNNNYENIKYIHACNSAGVLNFKEAHFNLVRPGLMLYGYLPEEYLYEKIDLQGSCILKSKISYVKEVDKDTSIGYGRSYITTKKTKIATVLVGYADGIKRILSNKGKVYINGKLCDIIGKVCMDSFTVDVTGVDNVCESMDVYIWDNDNITIEDIARNSDTISYEILTSISNRVVRRYEN